MVGHVCWKGGWVRINRRLLFNSLCIFCDGQLSVNTCSGTDWERWWGGGGGGKGFRTAAEQSASIVQPFGVLRAAHRDADGPQSRLCSISW